jgi:2-pyrone-4,6-dicarboxylate lactonase
MTIMHPIQPWLAVTGPHPNVKVMPNDGDLVDLIPLYAPDTAIQKELLVTNPERLFKFEAKS